MADIDMIPRSYREGLRVRRTLTIYGAALAVLLVAGAGASAFLRWRLGVETPRLDASRSASSQAGAMRIQLTAALARKELLAENVAALATLRGAGEVAALAERARWRAQRAGLVREAALCAHPGIAAGGAARAAARRAWCRRARRNRAQRRPGASAARSRSPARPGTTPP